MNTAVELDVMSGADDSVPQARKKPSSGRTCINDQIGDHLALLRSTDRGYVIAFKAHESPWESVHRYPGSVGDCLVILRLEPGAWIFEVEVEKALQYYLVRWNIQTGEWENYGKVRFGAL